jgi:ribosomal protein S18 acetylase RimI-like enzyme
LACWVYKELPASAQLQATIDIHWLGILPEFHRRGIGTRLIGTLIQIAKGSGLTLLTVETLDPSVADPNYLKTYAFYEKLGFQVSRRFKFGSDEPAVQMVRSL